MKIILRKVGLSNYLVSDKIDSFNKNISISSLIEQFPNYYTFSKAIAEDLVHTYKEKFPIAIARPSIVSASVKEPFPGWIEGINGPTGLMLALGKGILRTYYCDPTSFVEAIPCDMAANAMVAIGCKRGESRDSKILVYNLSTASKYSYF